MCTGDDVLLYNWYLLRMKKFQADAHISDKHPRPFYMRVPSVRTRSLFLLVFLPTSYWCPTTYVVYLTWFYLQMCFVYRLNFFEYETVHQIAK